MLKLVKLLALRKRTRNNSQQRCIRKAQLFAQNGLM